MKDINFAPTCTHRAQDNIEDIMEIVQNIFDNIAIFFKSVKAPCKKSTSPPACCLAIRSSSYWKSFTFCVSTGSKMVLGYFRNRMSWTTVIILVAYVDLIKDCILNSTSPNSWATA